MKMYRGLELDPGPLPEKKSEPEGELIKSQTAENLKFEPIS